MGEKIKVRRANVLLTVPKEQKDYYMERGYDVIGENGKVIEATVPTDVATLQRHYVEHLAQIKQLQDEVAQLKRDLENATKKPEKKESNNSLLAGASAIESVPEKRTRRKAKD